MKEQGTSSSPLVSLTGLSEMERNIKKSFNFILSIINK
jgi:hypothetical protein